MKKSVSGAREQDIKNTIGKFAAAFIKAREIYEKEPLTLFDLQKINSMCANIVRQFAAVDPKDRFFFHYTWEHINQGRDYGFGYLSHYICELFKELAAKRYEGKTTKDKKEVMEMAHTIKKTKNKTQSEAMKKAYDVIKLTGKLRTDSIQQECLSIRNTCDQKLWNSIMPSYPCLNKGLDGLSDKCRPKQNAVQLIADILGPLCYVIKYE